MDLVRNSQLVPQLAMAAELSDFDHIVPVSAKTRAGLDELRSVLIEALPAGEVLYPPDDVTDQPLEVRIAEIVREKALRVTREEVPHSVAVVVDEIERDAVTGFVTLS